MTRLPTPERDRGTMPAPMDRSERCKSTPASCKRNHALSFHCNVAEAMHSPTLYCHGTGSSSCGKGRPRVTAPRSKRSTVHDGVCALGVEVSAPDDHRAQRPKTWPPRPRPQRPTLTSVVLASTDTPPSPPSRSEIAQQPRHTQHSAAHHSTAKHALLSRQSATHTWASISGQSCYPTRPPPPTPFASFSSSSSSPQSTDLGLDTLLTASRHCRLA